MANLLLLALIKRVRCKARTLDIIEPLLKFQTCTWYKYGNGASALGIDNFHRSELFVVAVVGATPATPDATPGRSCTRILRTLGVISHTSNLSLHLALHRTNISSGQDLRTLRISSSLFNRFPPVRRACRFDQEQKLSSIQIEGPTRRTYHVIRNSINNISCDKLRSRHSSSSLTRRYRTTSRRWSTCLCLVS